MNKKAFTLVELLIVIAILAILTTVSVVSYSSFINKANDTVVIQNAQGLYTQYLSECDFIQEYPENTLIIKVQDNKYVAIVNGHLMIDKIYTSKEEAIYDNEQFDENTLIYPEENSNNQQEEEQNQTVQPSSPKIIYTIGDSITNGNGVNNTRWTLQAGWLKYVVTEENGFDTTYSKNLGLSGVGFVHGDHNYSLTAMDIIENSEELQSKPIVTGHYGNYTIADADVITVAIGINDWKDSSITLEAYFEEMYNCFARIREINPTCELIYIMPFNMKYYLPSATYDTYYAYDTKGVNNNALCYGTTLRDFKNMILEEFETQKYQNLNINIINIDGFSRDDLLKYENNDDDKLTDDGLHPNAAGYQKVGLELAEEITSIIN